MIWRRHPIIFVGRKKRRENGKPRCFSSHGKIFVWNLREGLQLIEGQIIREIGECGSFEGNSEATKWGQNRSQLRGKKSNEEQKADSIQRRMRPKLEGRSCGKIRKIPFRSTYLFLGFCPFLGFWLTPFFAPRAGLCKNAYPFIFVSNRLRTGSFHQFCWLPYPKHKVIWANYIKKEEGGLTNFT